MAIQSKFKIKFTCGHTETKDLSSTPAGKRKSKAYWLSQNFTCTPCFKEAGNAELKKRNQETLAAAEGFESEHDLEPLDGTEKQVPWATQVRYEVLTEILDSDETEDQAEQAEEVIESARQIAHAGWWLDNCTDKELTVEDLIELILTGPPNQQEHIQTENPF